MRTRRYGNRIGPPVAGFRPIYARRYCTKSVTTPGRANPPRYRSDCSAKRLLQHYAPAPKRAQYDAAPF